MHRPFTRRQALQNAAFLAALRQTGNARLAARELGVHRSTYTKRRARSAAFAAEWEAARAAAHAAFHLAGGARPPEAHPTRQSLLKTQGGEPTIVRLASGKLQLRLSPPGRITVQGEQAFFRALSASANIRLSSAAAGFAHSSFYRKRRVSIPFAREMRYSLKMGYDRLEIALLADRDPAACSHDGWRNNDPLPIPPMTAGEAIQLLSLHEKSVRQGWDQPHRRRRRGEPWEIHGERLRAMWVHEKAREAEDEATARALHYEKTGDWRLPEEPAPPVLPALEQVTGWSKAAKVKVVHNPDLAMFGGWRINQWRKKQRGG